MADEKTTEPRGCPTPGACSALAEIERLRLALEDIAGAQMMWHGGVGRPPYDLVAGHIDCMKQMATEALNHAYP